MSSFFNLYKPEGNGCIICPKGKLNTLRFVSFVIDFGIDQPNNLNLPTRWFQETCLKLSQENFCSNENEHSDFLQYGVIDGYYKLKNEIAEWLCEKYYSNLSVSKKLKINQVNNDENILVVKGSVPGKPGNLLSIVTSN